MAKTGGTATFVGSINGAQLIINGVGGTLNLGLNRVHTFTGNIALNAGTLEGNTSTLNFSGAWNGTGSNFVSNSSTVVLAGGGQNINTTTTFFNLTYAGTGAKAIVGGVTVTVNGTFTIANGTNGNTYTGALVYGASAGLRYNAGSANRTTNDNEWPSPFVATGGVTIDGTTPGTITLNGAKQMGNNTNVPLTLNPGSTLSTSASNFGLTFHGDFISNATLSAGASNILVGGTVANQNISGFTTTGPFQMTKTAGTATLTSSIVVDDIILNGIGGTLNLGSSSHTIVDDITLIAGTMLGGTSTLSVGDEFTQTSGVFTGEAFNLQLNSGNGQGIIGFSTTGNVTVSKSGGTATLSGNVNANNLTVSGGTFNLGTGFTHTFTGSLTRTAGTLNFGTNTLINLTGTGTVLNGTINAGTGTTLNLSGDAQTIATANSFHNLIFSGNGSKTVSGALSIINLFTISNAIHANSFISLNYGLTGGLVYAAGSSNRTVGGEWPSTFPGALGITIGGTGIITLDGNKIIGNGATVNSALTINSGAILATNNHQVEFIGDFINNGTFNAGSSNIVIGGSITPQNIGSFTTTGLVNMVRTGGITTFSGNVNGGGLTMNGTAGAILNLGSGLHHIFSGTWTRTNSVLQCGTSTLEFTQSGVMFSGTGGTFTPQFGTVIFSGAAQTCPPLTYFNLTLSGSGTKTFATSPTVSNIFSLEGTADVNVTTGVITYGASSTLRYNKSAPYTVTLEEFPATFSGVGGVTIAGTGLITLGATKDISYTLIINTGAQVNLGTGLTHSCRGLIRGGSPSASGNFGGTGSGATNIDPVFFAAATGQLNSFSSTATWDAVGAVNTDWENDVNWIEGAKPTAFTDAIIPAGPIQPTLTANAVMKGLEIQTGAVVTSAGFQLSINGNFVNNGTANFSTSTIVLTGGINQFIGGFTTTGTVSSTKTEGIAVFTGNINAGAISVNGVGGTLNFGLGRTHTINGNITITVGTLRGGSSTILLSGNLTGIYTGDSVNMTFTGTANQSIGAFTTTGNVSMTKTAGTATFTGNVNAASITINGTGGTLNLGNTLTHTFTGAVTLTNGTLNGGTTTTLNIAGNWSGTGTNFTSGTGTVVFNGGAQTISTSTVFNNLTLGGTGAKTFSASITINGMILLTNGSTHTYVGVTHGPNAGITYSATRTTNDEWPLNFNGTGGVTITAGTVTLNGGKNLGSSANLAISGGTFNTGNFPLTIESNFTGAGTFTAGSSNITFAGTANQNIRAITTTGAVFMTKTAGTATLTDNLNIGNIDVNGSGGTLSMGTGRTHTINGNYTYTAGTINFNNANIIFAGTAAQTIAGFSTTGNISMTKTANIATFAGNVNANNLTINGVGGTLNMGVGLNHTFTGTWTRTNGTLNGGSSTINFTASPTVVSGTGGTFTPGTGAVNYAGTAQTVGNLTYHNLILSNSGAKTGSSSVVVNNQLSLEGTATLAGAITYGGDASLRYNKPSGFTTTDIEFPPTFSSKGGVIVAGTGVITFNNTKNISAPLVINTGSQVNLGTSIGHSSQGLTLGGTPQTPNTYGGTTSAAAVINPTFFATATGIITVTNPDAVWLGLTTNWSTPTNWSTGNIPDINTNVTINSGTPQQPTLTANSSCGNILVGVGAVLTTAGFQLSISGNFTPTGTVNFGSSPIILTGILTQTIGSINTTGDISMTKTAGVATFSGNVNANSLILNGIGGTLNLGTGTTHSLTGNITITNGTLLGNTANIVLTGTANQSIAGFTTTGNIISNKTGGTATLVGNLNISVITVNGIGGTLNLGTALTHTINGNVTITAGSLAGSSSNITLAGTANQTIDGFVTTGSVTMTKTGGTATFNGNMSLNTLTLNGTGGTINLGTGTHSLTGNITITNGTLTGNAASLILTGTGAQTIAGLTTTGSISSTKTGGTATFGGNISANGLILNGIGGTIDLGLAARTHTFSGDITIIGGTLNGNAASVVLSGSGAQSVAGFTTTGTISMTKTGGGTATLTSNMNAGGLTLNGLGGILNLGAGLNHTFSGTWTRTNGTLDGGTSTINFTAPGSFISGSIGSFIPNGGTVNYAFAGDQTVGQFIYNNLTLSGSGIKTTASVTVNGILSLQGTATASAPISYGVSATLEYNRTTPFTTTINEFPNTFTASGGVVIAGTGTITLNAAKAISATLSISAGATLDLNAITTHTTSGLVFASVQQTAIGTYGRTGSGATNINDVFFAGTTGRILLSTTTTVWLGLNFDWTDPTNWTNGVPTSFSDVVINSGVPQQPIVTVIADVRDITINTGATLNVVGLPFSIYGNYINNGTAAFGSSPIIISGTANQSINGINTTGNLSVTKLGGTATLDGNLDVNSLLISGAGGTLNLGTGHTHTIRGNLTVSAGTITGNSSNIVLTGTASQTIAGLTTTGNITSTKTGGTATLTGNVNVNSIEVNGIGGTLNLGVGTTHTIAGNLSFTAGTINGGSSTILLSGNLSGAGTFTANASTLSLTGTTAQTIAGFTTTGNLNLTKTSNTATLNGNVSANELTINGVGGTLSLGTGFTHSFTGDVNLTNGTLVANNTTINVSSSTATAWNGNGSNFNAGTGSVIFDGGAQTINTSTTFNNLTLSGSGAKTFASGTTSTINGTHTIENGVNANVFTGATIAYGPTASIVYNLGGASRTVQEEWPALFSGTGGITINGSSPSTLTLNSAKQIGNNNNAALTINAGSTLTTNNFDLTLHGNFVNNGTINAGSSNVIISGSTATQNISGFTTTGNLSITKTSGTASITSNINANALTINATGATLQGGTGLTHTFTGDIALTAGTFNAGSCTINVNSTSATAWSGTGSAFVPGTSTVVFGGGAQTISAATTFNNLTLTGSGDKTITANTTVNGVLNVAEGRIANFGTNTLSGAALTTSGTGTIRTQNTSAAPIPNGRTWTQTVQYDATTGSQTFASGTYANLSSLNSSGTNTASGNIQVNDALIVATGGTLNMGSHALSGASITTTGTGTLRTQNTTATPIPTGRTWSMEVTYDAGSTQTVMAGTYSTLTASGSASKTMAGAITVGTLLNLNSKLALGSNTLTLNGAFTGTTTNSLTLNGSSNIIVGPSASDITLYVDQTTNGTTNRLNNLTYNRTGQNIILNDTLRVAGNITPSNGTLQTAGKLILISDASGTANLLSGAASGTYINGIVTVQRFIPSVARRWRFLGNNVQGSTLQDWKNEIYITGPGGSTNGFDQTQTNNPGVFYYNETFDPGLDRNSGWIPPSNILDALDFPGSGAGYRVFVRGDRSDPGRLTSSVTSQNAVTLDLIGSVFSGDFIFDLTYSGSTSPNDEDGWNLISNPYPSSYDWNAFHDFGRIIDTAEGTHYREVGPTIWIYNPNSNNYSFYNAISNAGTPGFNGIIPSGASFWIKTNNFLSLPTPELTFVEDFKVATPPLNTLFKSTENSSFTIRLFQDSLNYDDAIFKYITGSTVNRDKYDVIKFFSGVSITAWGNDSQHLALSCRPLNLTANDTLKLAVWAANGTYRLQFFNAAQLGVSDNVYLVDNFTNTFTNIKSTGSYTFSITSNANSRGMGRFYLVVQAPNTIPVTLLDFTATATPKKQVRLNWATQNEINSDRFEVERSIDGVNYEVIISQPAAGNSSQLLNYTTFDEYPANVNYYRLKSTDLDGTSTYSAVRRVIFGEASEAIPFEVYPNPVVEFVTVKQQSIINNVRIIDGMGHTLMTIQGNGQQSMQIDMTRFVPGFYFIETVDDNGNKLVQGVTKD
jgi:hypothetical protein